MLLDPYCGPTFCEFLAIKTKKCVKIALGFEYLQHSSRIQLFCKDMQVDQYHSEAPYILRCLDPSHRKVFCIFLHRFPIGFRTQSFLSDNPARFLGISSATKQCEDSTENIETGWDESRMPSRLSKPTSLSGAAAASGGFGWKLASIRTCCWNQHLQTHYIWIIRNWHSFASEKCA